MEYVDQAINSIREGFLTINHPKGLLIALAATLFMGSWRQWLPVAVVAVVIHIVIERLTPVLSGGGGTVTLPDNLMETSFWSNALALLLGYLVIIGVFFLVKSMLFRGGAAAKAKAH